jgi:hypothetical protein
MACADIAYVTACARWYFARKDIPEGIVQMQLGQGTVRVLVEERELLLSNVTSETSLGDLVEKCTFVSAMCICALSFILIIFEHLQYTS